MGRGKLFGALDQMLKLEEPKITRRRAQMLHNREGGEKILQIMNPRVAKEPSSD